MERLAGVVVVVGAVTAFPAAALADDGAEEVEETRVCPGCGEVIAASSVFCPSCHRYLPDAKVKTESRRRASATQGIPVREPARRRFAANVVGGFMAGSESTTAFGCWATLGIRPTALTVLGPGVGYQNYPNGGSVPVYFGLRRYLSRGTKPGLIYMRVGYNKAWLKEAGWPFSGDEDPSGMFFGGGVGVDFLTQDGAGFTLEFGGRVEVTTMFYVFMYPGGKISPVQKRQTTLGLVRMALGGSF